MISESPISIFNKPADDVIPVADITKITDAVYSREHIRKARMVNLVCCSDYIIRKLNREYRKKDRVTDVLSFPFDDNDVLGEIYISIKRTAVQARRYGVPFKSEFTRLFLHGLLHLAGFDHIVEHERTIMERKELSYLDMCDISHF